MDSFSSVALFLNKISGKNTKKKIKIYVILSNVARRGVREIVYDKYNPEIIGLQRMKIEDEKGKKFKIKN